MFSEFKNQNVHHHFFFPPPTRGEKSFAYEEEITLDFPVWAINPITSVCVRIDREILTQKKSGGNMIMGAEIGMMQPKVKEYQRFQKLEK